MESVHILFLGIDAMLAVCVLCKKHIRTIMFLYQSHKKQAYTSCETPNGRKYETLKKTQLG